MRDFLVELKSIPAPGIVRFLIAAIVVPIAFVIVIGTMPIWGLIMVIRAFKP